MILMSDAYNELLDAAIQHLQELKGQGVRFVPVAPESLAALNEMPRPVASPRVSVPQRQPATELPTQKSVPAIQAPSAEKISASSLITRHSSPEKIAAFAALRERVLA